MFGTYWKLLKNFIKTQNEVFNNSTKFFVLRQKSYGNTSEFKNFTLFYTGETIPS